MMRETEAFELELIPELAQHPKSYEIVVELLLEALAAVEDREGSVGARTQLIDLVGRTLLMRAAERGPDVSQWGSTAIARSPLGVKIVTHGMGEIRQHGMAGFIESAGAEKAPLLCLSATLGALERLREGASGADAPEGGSTKEHSERRGLSMDEILAEVEQEREEKGAPVAERLLGVPAHKRHAAVLEGLPYEAFENVRQALGVSAGDLARVIGSSERTMRRRKESGTLSEQESDALVRVATAFERATRALDEERAVQWLTSPHPLLGGDRALDLLRTSAGAEIAREMLGAIEHGMPV